MSGVNLKAYKWIIKLGTNWPLVRYIASANVFLGLSVRYITMYLGTYFKYSRYITFYIPKIKLLIDKQRYSN